MGKRPPCAKRGAGPAECERVPVCQHQGALVCMYSCAIIYMDLCVYLPEPAFLSMYTCQDLIGVFVCSSVCLLMLHVLR